MTGPVTDTYRRILLATRPHGLVDADTLRIDDSAPVPEPADGQTLGLAEDVSRKLQGTLWIDEADRLVVHMEVGFNDDFRIAGGLFASIEKGSNLRFDQALVNAELWLPTGAEANLQGRLLMIKSYRQHLTERDYDFKRLRVEAQQLKDVKALPERKR